MDILGWELNLTRKIFQLSRLFDPAPKNNDPKEPKLRDFSYISMTNPPIAFWGRKMAKKTIS